MNTMKLYLHGILLLLSQCLSAQFISSVAGNGKEGYAGSYYANMCSISPTNGLFVDSKNNIYFSEYFTIRKVTASNGYINDFIGQSSLGFGGDGGNPKNAFINTPTGIYVDKNDIFYFCDWRNRRIRKVANGVITTIAGNGIEANTGDGGLAINASLASPWAITGDDLGNIYFTDNEYGVIRKINTLGIISTVAGTGTIGYTGDGGLAINAQLGKITSIFFDKTGNLYVSDFKYNSLRKINPAGFISSIYGSLSMAKGDSGDGGPVSNALFSLISCVVNDSLNNFYILDQGNNKIRKIMANTGNITTIEGLGNSNGVYNSDLALYSSFGSQTVASFSNGSLYFICQQGFRILKISNATPLPLQLINFSGSQIYDTRRLNWETMDEKNTNTFEIQRSLDGINFNPIGSVKSSNTSGNKKNYEFVDQSYTSTSSQKIFYRLKIIDLDGQFTYSKVISITIDADKLFITYPNPTQKYLFVKSANVIQIVITNSEGKRLLTQRINSVDQKVDIQKLSPGLYFITGFDSNGKTFLSKIVVN